MFSSVFLRIAVDLEDFTLDPLHDMTLRIYPGSGLEQWDPDFSPSWLH